MYRFCMFEAFHLDSRYANQDPAQPVSPLRVRHLKKPISLGKASD